MLIVEQVILLQVKFKQLILIIFGDLFHINISIKHLWKLSIIKYLRNIWSSKILHFYQQLLLVIYPIHLKPKLKQKYLYRIYKVDSLK